MSSRRWHNGSVLLTKAMRWANDYRAPLSLLAGVLLPMSIAALLVPFRATFADAAVSLVLAAVVTLVNARSWCHGSSDGPG